MPNESGQIRVEAPSNIAFVKYWGKQGRQYPINPSISMTLKTCVTKCRIQYQKSDRFSLDRYTFEGQDNTAFQKRIEKYLSDISDICPALNTLSLSIETENTFPHSAGIASSASAFAALGYALAHMEQANNIEARASELARLGSGSAARSIQGPYTIWGEYETEQASNDAAQPIDDIHEDFKAVKDTILLINQGEKDVSSSAGHALMNNHPFYDSRIRQAQDNTAQLLSAMRSGDWESFGDVVENEALSLHAMMMTSSPSFVLLAPETLSVISKVKAYRKETNQSLYFTIDAGPNVHLIYPAQNSDAIESFIKSDLAPHCQNGQIISDQNGTGARLIHD